MPAAFAAWCPVGGHVNPFHNESSFDNDEQVQKYARKYKHGKPVGRNELIEKFKALEIVDFDRYHSGLSDCAWCSWMDLFLQKAEEEGEDEHDDEDEHDEYDCHMFNNEDCKLPCQGGFLRPWNRGRTTGVYALNREAFAIHDAHRRRERSSASHWRRHRSSGQKRSALKKDARDALRHFDSRE